MWHLCESAHAVLTDEGGAILGEHSGRWYFLTPTASAAVMLLLASTSQEEAADRFAERYGIGAERAATDVRAVARMLTAHGLTRDAAPPRACRRWRRWWS
ncbi:PqqD family protein [Streptomyces antibioticus]